MDEERGGEKDERMAAGTRKRYSPNDSVKCHISADRAKGEGLAVPFQQEGSLDFWGIWREVNITLF